MEGMSREALTKLELPNSYPSITSGALTCPPALRSRDKVVKKIRRPKWGELVGQDMDGMSRKALTEPELPNSYPPITSRADIFRLSGQIPSVMCR